MNPAIMIVVLAGGLVPGQNPSPVWQSDYSQAQQQSAAQKKPIAVVFGPGADGWTKIVRDGAPTAAATQLLAREYICVYVDTTSPAGKKLATDFGVRGATGIVLSNRTGSLQGFWHQGDMASDSLTNCLRKYADPAMVVRRTETLTTLRTSFYPPTSSGEAIDWNATTNGGGAYCPSCNNVRSRR